ncbi:MAG: nucleoside phosphorylase [Syntrophobacteraceae bacterium]
MPADEHSCMIEPRRGRHEESLPSNAILVFSPEDLAYLSACFSQPLRHSHDLYLSGVFTGACEGAHVAIAGPMLGAPQAVLVLERMIALGVRKFIAAGWCGSLRNEVRIGDIVLPSGAISEEGTSGHYPGAVCAPSSALFDALKSALTSTGQTIREGTVWTTDAPFRETFAKIRAFQSQGVLSVDMETSALFSVSRFRGVELAVVLVVSDDISGMKWVHGFRDPAFHASRKNVMKSILMTISRI